MSGRFARMKITFRYSIGDRLAFAAYHIPRTPMALLMSIGFLLFITFEGIIPEIPKDKPASFQILYVSFSETILAFLIVAFWIITILAGVFFSKDKALMADRTIALGEDCFVSDTSFAHSEYKWLMVQKLARTRRHIFLYLNKDSAVIIPRRAFKSASDWDGFYDYCQSKTRRVS
jgi:hypothetical protein